MKVLPDPIVIIILQYISVQINTLYTLSLHNAVPIITQKAEKNKNFRRVYVLLLSGEAPVQLSRFLLVFKPSVFLSISC